MRELHKKGQAWVSAGLISEGQWRAIQSFEAKDSGNGLVFWLLWLAAASIALGIIALIASNWALIPAGAKLFTYSALYGFSAYCLIKKVRDRPIVSEILRLFLMAYTMAGIGLVAQIFHLHSAPYRGIFFWSALSFGIMLQCRQSFASILWLVATYIGFVMFLDKANVSSNTQTLVAVSVIGFLGCFGSSQRSISFLGPLQNAAFLLASIVVYVFSSIEFSFLFRTSYINGPVLGLSLFCLFLWAYILWQRKDLLRVTRQSFMLYLGSIAIQLLLLGGSREYEILHLPAKFVSLIGFAGGGLALALSAFSYGRVRIFEFLILLIPIRFFLLYADNFFLAIFSGFGFILFGLLILAGIYFWQKNKEKIYQRLEEELKRV